MNKILKMMLNFYGTILSPNITNEPPHDKTNIMTCAPSEDSDQLMQPPSLIKSSLCAQWVANDPTFFMRTAVARDDLSLFWTHMPLCWFCHEAAQMSL